MRASFPLHTISVFLLRLFRKSSLFQHSTTAEKTRRRINRRTQLLRQGVVFGESGAQLGHRRVGVGPGPPDAIGPGLDQGLGCLLPQRGLLCRQWIDLMTALRLDLVEAGVFEPAPGLADAPRSLRAAIVVDCFFLT